MHVIIDQYQELFMTPSTTSYVLDPARLFALDRLDLLDSPPEPAYDRLTALTARLLHVPVALISLVDRDRQFFKSQVGLAEPWASARQTPLSHSFCQYVVSEQAPLVVTDARNHPLLADNLAIPDLGVIAYAGVPLRSPEGEVIGSFCAIDTQPRVWTAEELAILEDLNQAVMTEIMLRDKIHALQEMEAQRLELQDQLLLTNKALLDDLSLPLLTVAEGVSLLLLRGAFDSYRVRQLRDKLTTLLASAGLATLVLDLEGMRDDDQQLAATLLAAPRVQEQKIRLILIAPPPELVARLEQAGCAPSVYATAASAIAELVR
jgi:GAF domain-containing protein